MKTFTIYSRLPFFSLLLLALQSVFFTSAAQTPVLYGMTSRGGTSGTGAIIKFNPATGKDSVVWNLGSGNDGQSPHGDLVYDVDNGLFYALAYNGGSNDNGAIIRFNPTNNTDSLVWSFGIGTDGQSPNSDLVYDTINRLFYGTTYSGGSNGSGIIFSFNPGTNAENVVWNFGSGKDGQHPSADLVYYSTNGLYYATTGDGGTTGYGTIISFNPTTNKDSVLWNFGNGLDATGPGGDLIYNAGSGLFYALTQYGGKNNDGTIISFNPATNKDSVLWSFGSGKDGKYPAKSFVYDAGDSLYYATTNTGGNNGDGSIISFSPITNAENVVWNFRNGTDGDAPFGNITFDTNNALFYGMTFGGGTHSGGTIFSFDPLAGKDSVVWNLGGGTDGASPYGSLTQYALVNNTGVKAISNPSANIFPNPASSQVTVSGLRSGQLLEIYNYMGQEISSTIIENVIKQFDLSNYVNGIYIVRILNADGTIAVIKKVVKVD